ncbi:hypothetical protein BC830DRAFT_1166080, partial [Chytriomyces sp. MP71]
MASPRDEQRVRTANEAPLKPLVDAFSVRLPPCSSPSSSASSSPASSPSSSPKSPASTVLVLFPSAALPPNLRVFAFTLVKSNLLNLYLDAQDTGWSDKTKMTELSEPDGRYLIAFNRVVPPLHPSQPPQQAPNEQRQNTPLIITHDQYMPHEHDTPIGYLYYLVCMEDSYDDQDGGMHSDGKAPVIY